MSVIFHFPILHESCDKCQYRFECMTMKIHTEVESVGSRQMIMEVIPFRIGLACFSLEPRNRIYSMKLELIRNKESMLMEAKFS